MTPRDHLVDRITKLQRIAPELTPTEWWNIWRALVAVYQSDLRLN